MYRLNNLFFFLFLLVSPMLLCGQSVTPRVAGLENNAQYMNLLQQEQRLRQSEDSIVKIIDATRQLFGSNIPNNEKEQHGATILQLEKELFELRNNQGVTANEIGAIEQDFVLKNLNAPAETSTAKTPTPAAGKQIANLIYNPYFKENLSVPDYKALLEAQQLEALPMQLLDTYLDNYRKIDSLTLLYDTTTSKLLAEASYGQLGTLRSLNQMLDDSLTSVWNYIYDNKTFAYNYLLDKMGKSEMLNQFDGQFRNNRQQMATMQDSVASVNVYGYPLNKRLILGYEEALASLLGYTAARDSVARQLAVLKQLHYNIPKIAFKERSFIEYAPIERTSPSKYNASNPIPEMELYRQGTVYRIQVGTFAQKQGVSIFRGVSPLCYELLPDGRFRYYAGAFREVAEAETDLTKMKSMGFRKPEIVVWRDGVYQMLGETTDSTTGEVSATTAFYRIEIIGQGENISSEVRKLANTQAPGKELTRTLTDQGTYIYSIGNFESREAAETLCTALNTLMIDSATVIEIKN